VTADNVAPAFVDNSGRPPLELVRAEALDASGTVVASVTVVDP
jgi:hypothetical protein